MNILPEIPLDTFQAEAFARGLFSIARADGVHEREAALIAAFWSDAGGGPRALSELERHDPITSEELGSILSSPELRQAFLKTALMLTFADGEVSDKERALIHAYTKHFNMQDELPQLEAQVKEYLLSQLAHIHNAEGLAKIAKKLAL